MYEAISLAASDLWEENWVHGRQQGYREGSRIRFDRGNVDRRGRDRRLKKSALVWIDVRSRTVLVKMTDDLFSLHFRGGGAHNPQLVST